MEQQEVKVIPVYGNCGSTACKLIDKMKDGKPGDVLTDVELAGLCGRNTSPGGNGYPALQTAIHHCENDGVVWRRVPGEKKIACQDGVGVLNLAKHTRKRVGKQMRGSGRRLRAINPADLPNDQARQQHRNEAVTALFVADAVGESVVKQLGVKDIPPKINRDAVLRLCQGV